MLSSEHLATLAAFADTIFPPGSDDDPDEPGGSSLNAHHYVARSLDGAYREHLDQYLTALQALDGQAQSRFAKPFKDLAEDERTEILQAMERGEFAPGA